MSTPTERLVDSLRMQDDDCSACETYDVVSFFAVVVASRQEDYMKEKKKNDLIQRPKWWDDSKTGHVGFVVLPFV